MPLVEPRARQRVTAGGGGGGKYGDCTGSGGRDAEASSGFHHWGRAAEWHDLVVLPGIGPTLARRIVALRDTKEGQRFERLEEIAEAKRVSVKLVERIRPYVFLGQEGDPD